jgi:hypothetical protein
MYLYGLGMVVRLTPNYITALKTYGWPCSEDTFILIAVILGDTHSVINLSVII